MLSSPRASPRRRRGREGAAPTGPSGLPRSSGRLGKRRRFPYRCPRGNRRASAAVPRRTRGAIFAEAGIELGFFVGSPEDHGIGDARAIRIVLMPRSAEGWTLQSDAMGAVMERNARAGTVYIFVPVVERIIGHAPDGRMLHDGRKSHALARALARVLAHETIHAIDPDIPHGPEGSVMSDNLTRFLEPLGADYRSRR